MQPLSTGTPPPNVFCIHPYCSDFCIFYYVLAVNAEYNICMWKQARQEIRQHWFIYSYIAAYIQALYMYQCCWSTPNWSDRRSGV